jgi:TRAP-type C4-dicarboxylate transport system permease small subunit
MSRDTVRALLIVVGLALIATVFSETSARIAAAISGAIAVIFILLIWYFGYRWYQENRMAISLMPDRERSILYLGMGAVTVTLALFSLSQFGLVELGAFWLPVLVIFLAGAFAIFYAWQESKRYTL